MSFCQFWIVDLLSYGILLKVHWLKDGEDITLFRYIMTVGKWADYYKPYCLHEVKGYSLGEDFPCQVQLMLLEANGTYVFCSQDLPGSCVFAPSWQHLWLTLSEAASFALTSGTTTVASITWNLFWATQRGFYFFLAVLFFDAPVVFFNGIYFPLELKFLHFCLCFSKGDFKNFWNDTFSFE